MTRLVFPVLMLALGTGCYDYTRLLTTLQLDPTGGAHTVRLEFVDVSPDEDECEKGPEACAASLHDLRDHMGKTLFEDVGLTDIQARVEQHGDAAHIVYEAQVPTDSDLLAVAGLDVELWGRPGKERRRFVVSGHSELGTLTVPTKATRRLVQRVVEDQGLQEQERYELHRRTRTLSWEEAPDDPEEAHHIFAAVDGMSEFVDTSTVAFPAP